MVRHRLGQLKEQRLRSFDNNVTVAVRERIRLAAFETCVLAVLAAAVNDASPSAREYLCGKTEQIPSATSQNTNLQTVGGRLVVLPHVVATTTTHHVVVLGAVNLVQKGPHPFETLAVRVDAELPGDRGRREADVVGELSDGDKAVREEATDAVS